MANQASLLSEAKLVELKTCNEKIKRYLLTWKLIINIEKCCVLVSVRFQSVFGNSTGYITAYGRA